MNYRAKCKLNPISLGVGLSMLCGSQAWAVQMDAKHFGVDVKFTVQSEDDRDLGTRGGGDANGAALDLRPWVRVQRGDWSVFAMGQAVVASDIIQTDTLESSTSETDASQTDGRTREKNYLALREFWVDYAGLTDYPGEHLRLGRQRLRNEDGQWRDTNIEALNWRFDTSLLEASLGVAQRFSEYRTDIDELAPEDEDRLHLFADVAGQWQPGHWVGVRVHHSRDDGELADPNQPIDTLDKRANGDLTWLGLHAHSDAYNVRNQQRLNYWASLTSLTGERNSLNNDVDDGIAGGQNSTNLNAWATDLGLRLRLDPNWQIGAAYARGSGGGDDDGNGNDNYRQTGLQSNRSTFAGTRSSVQRFGEAFRGELSNLQAATLFGTWQLADEYEASLVYHHFWRVDEHQQIGRSGINARFDDPLADLSPAPQVALVDGEKELGQELDLVVTKYFKQGLLPAAMSEAIDEPAALVRFRGGVFKPGDAYGSDTDSLMHRAFIDVIWKF
ncbi:alginate export family protein [Pseudomonas sp. EA_35y_Pfl2_R111]|uniref:alginate export family protein n=1 Tax=Pseudomonas sp. EA_35y_Pfl2_R111 TaxID=3088689 RepID=UPI00403F7378